MEKKENGKAYSDVSGMLVSAKALAEMFNVTQSWIRTLERDGILVKESRGKYDLKNSVKNYIMNLRVKIDEQTQADPRCLDEDLEGELDLDKEKAIHERVKRHISELRLALMKGDVHKSEDVEMVMTDMLSKFKTRIECLPSKLAPIMAMETNKEKVKDILDREMRQVLEQLSEYNASDFASQEFMGDNDE